MQPIIYIDDQSVYDCRTHSLIKLSEFDIEIILGSLIKIVQASEWEKKLKRISLLVVAKFQQQIKKILSIIEKLDSSLIKEKETYSPDDVQIMLITIIKKYLEQREYITQDQKNQEISQLQQEPSKQEKGLLNENLQQNIPLTDQTILFNLAEKIKGFCIQYPWWNKFKQKFEEANTDEEIELLLNEIAPILMNRWRQIKKQKPSQSKENLGKLCSRLLDLIGYQHLDVEITDKEICEAYDQLFIEFLDVIFQVLKLLKKINISIDIQEQFARVKINDHERVFQNQSQNQLKVLAYMYAIKQIQNLRSNSCMKQQTTFEVVASILEQLLPPSDTAILNNLKYQIELNKQNREKHKFAEEIKIQVKKMQKQNIYKEEEQDKNLKKENFKNQFNQYLQREAEKNEQKEELNKYKKRKSTHISKNETQISEDSVLSGFSFRAEEKMPNSKKPKLAPENAKIFQQQQSLMFPYFYPYPIQQQQQQLSKDDLILLTLNQLLKKIDNQNSKQ